MNLVQIEFLRSQLELVSSEQHKSGVQIDKLLTSTESRDRGQHKTNERIDEHIQVYGCRVFKNSTNLADTN